MTENSEEMVEAKPSDSVVPEAGASIEQTEKPAPKRRGRKPKAKVSDLEEGSAPSVEEEAKPAPKRRGRKPKAKLLDDDAKGREAQLDPGDAASSGAAEADGSLQESTSEERPAPKRRGRKPKAKVEPSVQEGLPSGEDGDSPKASDEVVPAKKPTRKRASSKKSEPSSEVVASDEKTQAGEAKDPFDEVPASGRDAAAPQSADTGSEGPLSEANAQEGSKDVSFAEPRPRRRRQQRDDRADGTDRQERRDRPSQHDAHNNRRRDRFDSRKKDKRDRNKPVQPKTSREELAALKVAELREKATELGVEHKGLLKAALVEAVFEASLKAEGFVEVEGILDIMPDGFGFVRTNGYFSGPGDAYVHASLVRKFGLRKGDLVKGQTRPARRGDKFPALQSIYLVNGKPLEEAAKRPRFAELTPVFPDERLVMEHGRNTLTARVIDLCAPIGKGQRGLIVSPPKAGKTTVLKNIAAAISANNPEVHLICLLVDERPEEVTDMQRSINGEVVASTFDMPCENHINCAEMVIERAKRLVEDGEDVVVLLDSLTRLARAYNLAQPASGRILSGGVDSTALYPPKKFLGAARNIEGGGSLTILASALVETGSKMDEVIFEEFKGTGNMELKLDRQLAERRIFPAIDPVASGTRREDLLLDPQEAPLIWAVRRILSNRNNTERAMDTLIKSLRATRNNQEFLLRTAKKAQGRSPEDNLEL